MGMGARSGPRIRRPAWRQMGGVAGQQRRLGMGTRIERHDT
ncbi:hypothetical protein AMB3_1931 [plant metagenome]